MPILNYTTKVSAANSAGQIQSILGSKGARAVTMGYENGEPESLHFCVDIQNSPANFRLPCNWRGVLKVLEADRKVPNSYKSEMVARRVAWRILKTWIEAQMAIIEAGQATIAEVFLPYCMTSRGKSVYELIYEKPELLLSR